MISMTRRLTFGYAFAVTAGVVIALLAGRWLLEREMIGGLNVLHEMEFREMLAEFGRDPNEMAEEELIAAMGKEGEEDAAEFMFQVHDGRGRILFRSAMLGRAMLPDLSVGGESWTVDIPPFGRVHTSEFVHGRLHFQIASRLAPAERVLRHYTEVSAVIAAVAALASLAFGFGISRVALRPLRDIERTARRISADRLAERIPQPPGRDEVAELVRLLNAMIERLEGSFRQAREFSADASHELRTPLTLVRLHAERLRAQLTAGPARAEADGLLEEIGGMNEVIDRLLFLSRMEGGALLPTRKEMDTAAWVAAVEEDATALVEDRGMRFAVVRNEAGRACFDPALLRQLVLNLVGNAANASAPGGQVSLSSTDAADSWLLEVMDEGRGVAPEQLERIFERFVQVPASAKEAAGGHGIGLTICRSIVRLHGGTIRAVNRADGPGLRVEVRLPRDA